MIRCRCGLIEWTKDKLRTMDKKTRKTMTVHRALHPQADVDRPYIPRNKGGSGMITVEDYVKIETESLKKYVESSKERLLNTVEREEIIGEEKTKKF